MSERKRVAVRLCHCGSVVEAACLPRHPDAEPFEISEIRESPVTLEECRCAELIASLRAQLASSEIKSIGLARGTGA